MTKRIICAVCAFFILVSFSFASNDTFESVDITDSIAFYDGMAAVKISGYWGFIDKSDNIAVACQYHKVKHFSENRAFVKDKTGWRCIDKTGQVIFTLDCSDVFPFSEGLARFIKDGFYGFVDTNGQIICEPKWTDARDAKNGFIAVSEGELYGYINYTGELFIEEKYDEAYDFTKNAAYVVFEGEGQLINPEGETICTDVCGDIVDGLAKIKTVSEDGTVKYGFVNESGNVSIWPVWDDVDIPSEGRVAVKKDGKWGYVDYIGNTCSEFIWDLAAQYKCGFARVAKLPEGETLPTSFVYSGYNANFDYTYLNTSGEIINEELSYKNARDFSDGRAAVCAEDLWGFIDTNGTLVIPCIYDSVSDFTSNNAVVCTADTYSVCNDKGDIKTFYAAGEERKSSEPENKKSGGAKTFHAKDKKPENEKRGIVSYISMSISAVVIIYCALLAALRFMSESKQRKKLRRRQKHQGVR